MVQHIGILACSAEGAALCYRTICAEGPALLRPQAHPEVTLTSASLADYVACLERGDLAGVGRLMLASAQRLEKAGADFLICPDNTIHQALPAIADRLPLPFVHIAEVVAEEAVARGFRRLALLGTRWLVESAVYPEVLTARGLACERPDAAARAEVDRIIMEELVPGHVTAEATAYFHALIGAMGRGGCDAAILGCTEIPLAIDESKAPLPCLDSTRLLARAALKRAVAP